MGEVNGLVTQTALAIRDEDELEVAASILDAALRRAKADGKEYAWNEAAMRAACAGHRACCGIEANNSQGKIHGYCVVCGVPWPCETAQFFLFKADARAAQIEEGVNNVENGRADQS